MSYILITSLLCNLEPCNYDNNYYYLWLGRQKLLVTHLSSNAMIFLGESKAIYVCVIVYRERVDVVGYRWVGVGYHYQCKLLQGGIRLLTSEASITGLCTKLNCWVTMFSQPVSIATFVSSTGMGIYIYYIYTLDNNLCMYSTAEIFCWTKISPVRAGSEIGENFWPCGNTKHHELSFFLILW